MGAPYIVNYTRGIWEFLMKNKLLFTITICITLIAILLMLSACNAGYDGTGEDVGTTTTATTQPPPQPSPSTNLSPTEGLEYTLLHDGTYEVSVGSATDVKHIIIPSTYEDRAVTGIADGAFSSCIELKNITIPSSVKAIGDSAFRGCMRLVRVTFEKDSMIKSIGGYAFERCYNLESINLGESKQLESIGDYAFSECRELKSITVPSTLTNISSSSFWHCYRLVEVYDLSNLDIKKGDYRNGGIALYALGLYKTASAESRLITDKEGFIVYNGDDKKILIDYDGNETDVIVPDGIAEIKNHAFYYNTRINSIKIPSMVKDIGDGAFDGCSRLESVTFEENSQLEYIKSHTFGKCYSLESITIPSSVTGISPCAFFWCENLESVTFEEGSRLTSIGFSAFERCTSLKSIEIPSEVTSIEFGVFSKCTDLINIGVDEANTAYKSIDGNLYTKDGKKLVQYACGKTQTAFKVPDGVESIEDDAFYGCESIESVTIPLSVTSIGFAAFHDCKSLASAEFENPNGWWYSSSAEATNRTAFSSDDLSNHITAAEYLSIAYSNKYWKLV